MLASVCNLCPFPFQENIGTLPLNKSNLCEFIDISIPIKTNVNEMEFYEVQNIKKSLHIRCLPNTLPKEAESFLRS
jgi:hypothetical protein